MSCMNIYTKFDGTKLTPSYKEKPHANAAWVKQGFGRGLGLSARTRAGEYGFILIPPPGKSKQSSRKTFVISAYAVRSRNTKQARGLRLCW